MSISAVVELNTEKAEKYLAELNWQLLINEFDKAFKLKFDENGTPISFEYSPVLKNLLQKVLQEITRIIEENRETGCNLQNIILHTYRALRNIAITPEAQNSIFKDATIMECTKLLLQKLLIDGEHSACIKTILQFLCNLTIHAENKVQLLRLLDTLLVTCMLAEDSSYISCALLYNLIKDEDLDLNTIDENIYNVILDLCEKERETNEYLSFIFETLVKSKYFYKNYPNFATGRRVVILRRLKDCNLNDESNIDCEFIDILVHQFKIKSDCILKTVTDYLNDIEPLEVSYLLGVLASLSSNDNYLPHLQSDKSLLINSAFLLKSIHSLGKATENNFTMIQKLSAVTDPSDNVKDHPAFGFKALLIRILGNMCWKNKMNQDELRELDIITIILDCCNIDARNPFIMQWAIFTARSLCENNVENQQIIASLTKQGVVSSAVVQELGLRLQDDGANPVTVVPLEALKSANNTSKMK